MSGETLATFDDLGKLRLIGVELERRQEAQGAQVEGHDRGDALLRGNENVLDDLEAGNGYSFCFLFSFS